MLGSVIQRAQIQLICLLTYFFLTLSPVHLVCVCWCPMRLEECVALELELEVTVRHLTWVLGNELWSFERATSTLNH